MFIFRYQLGIISLIPMCKSLQTPTFTSRSLFIEHKPFRLLQLRSSLTSSPFDDTDIKLKLKDMSSDDKDECIINQASNIRELQQKLKDATVNSTQRKVVKSKVISIDKQRITFEVKSDDDKLVRVPYNKPFVKLIENCQNIHKSTAPYVCQHLIGFEDSIKSAVEIVMKELPLDDLLNSSFPKKPLVISRLGRGGKTTALMALFDRLQGAQLGADRVKVMLISFRIAPFYFYLREEETQAQAILRVIAHQLVEGTDDELDHLLVDEYALDDYIGETPFVLLINQINLLSRGQPLDDEAADLLRRMFLRKNRYLVMTTLIPMDVDDMHNKRGYYRIPVPISMNLTELRAMSNECANVTALDVAFYGGIPPLIYCVKMFQLCYEDRYRYGGTPRAMTNLRDRCYYGTEGSIEDSTGELSKKFALLLYSRLIGEFVTGSPCWASVSVLTPDAELHRMFYQFSYMTASGQLIWPLCYMRCILEEMWVDQYNSFREAHWALLSLLERLAKQVTAGQSDKKGKGWELVLQIGILLNCIDCYLNQRVEYPLSEASRPFSLVPAGTRSEVGYLELSPNIKTADGAWAYILEKLEEYDEPTIILVVPMHAAFPMYDMFLVYTPGTTAAAAASEPGPVADGQALDTLYVRVAGIQTTKRRKGMKQPIPGIPAFVNSGSYLAHGHSGKRARGTSPPPPGWMSLSEVEVQRLLGFSLAPLASIDWTK